MKQPGRPRKLPGVVTYAPPSQTEEPRSPASWLQEGIDNGWCTGWYCANHDGAAYEDMDELDRLYDEFDGPDFCWPIVNIKKEFAGNGTRSQPSRVSKEALLAAEGSG